MIDQNDNFINVQTKKHKSNSDEWINGPIIRFEVIRRIEFNSERKRMSILLKDLSDGLTKLYIKGADNVILERISALNSED